jgi:hypothetical protein
VSIGRLNFLIMAIAITGVIKSESSAQEEMEERLSQ